MNFTVSVDPQPVSAADKDAADVHDDTRVANRTLTDTRVTNDTVVSVASVSTAVTLPAPFIRNNRRLIICHAYFCIVYNA